MPKSGHDVGNPAIERDLRSMDRKKRVREVLDDPFRKELEGVVISQREGNKPLFHAGIKMSGSGGSFGSSEFKGASNVRQVNDLHGSLRDRYSKAERVLRCKLAALYRLTAYFEWDHLIYSHITARLPGEDEHFLINPYGMQYCEVTASSLIKIDKEGNILDPGSTVLPVNKAGFKLNSALHGCGQNIVYHTHSHAGTAISAMECGLLNLCQEAIIVRPVSYSTYQGFVPTEEEQKQLQSDLEDDSHVIILENHGLVSVGKTIEEAFLWMAQLTKACEIQWRVLRCGKDNLHARTFDSNKAFEGDLPVELVCNPNGREYGPGELEFESYMRKLDSEGANTGYPYKTPTIFKDQLPSYPSVQYPPIVPGMEGPPSDTERSRPSSSQRSAWFKNPVPVEQRISPPSSDGADSWNKTKPDGKDKKGHPKRFAPFDSVISPPSSQSGSSSSSGKRGRKKKKSKPDFSFIDDLEAKLRAGAKSDEDDMPPPRPPPPASDGSRKPSSSSDVEEEFVEEQTVEHASSRKSSSSSSSELSADFKDPSMLSRKSHIGQDSPDPDMPGLGGDEKPRKGSDDGGNSTDGSGYARVLAAGKALKTKVDSSDDEGPGRPPLPRKSSSSSKSSDGYHSTRSSQGVDSDSDETTTCDFVPEHSVEHEVFVGGVLRPVDEVPRRESEDGGSSDFSIEEVELLAVESIHSSASSDSVSDPSSDGKRSDEPEVHSLSDDTDKSMDVVVSADLDDMPPCVEMDSVDLVDEAPLVGMGFVDPNQEAVPYLSRDVTVDAKMSVTTDYDTEHDVLKEVEVRVGEDGVSVVDEVTQHTITTSIVEITEIQEDEYEVITVRPGQLTLEQREELIRQGYVLQEAEQ